MTFGQQRYRYLILITSVTWKAAILKGIFCLYARIIQYLLDVDNKFNGAILALEKDLNINF